LAIFLNIFAIAQNNMAVKVDKMIGIAIAELDSFFKLYSLIKEYLYQVDFYIFKVHQHTLREPQKVFAWR
jgi:hypothetical protein